MTGAQTSLLPPTPGEERDLETDTAERGDDPTPRGVIRAALEASVPARAVGTWKGSVTKIYDAAVGSCATRLLNDAHPLRVLDVCAGYGAWASEMRRLAQAQGWPVHITGVELHEAREKHLAKWCDDVAMCGWQVWFDDPTEPWTQYDLIIGNPPFDELTGPKGAKRPPEECMPAVLLRHAPAVLLLHTQQAFLKSEAGRASWRANPPAASWLVPGGVKFRGQPGGADSRCYQVTLWLRGHTGPCSVYMLDDLSPGERSWTVPPGTEEPSKCQRCNGSGELKSVTVNMGGESAPPGKCPNCIGSGLEPNGDLPSAPGWQKKVNRQTPSVTEES